MWQRINSREFWNNSNSFPRTTGNSTCSLKSIWIEAIWMKLTIISLFKTLISTIRMGNLSPRHMLIVSLTFSKNLDSTRPVSEMTFHRTWRICWEELEEKLRRKESELLILWRISISLGMVTSLRISLGSPSTWPNFHCLRLNSHLYWNIIHAKIRRDTSNGSDSPKTSSKYSVWGSCKKHCLTRNSILHRPLSIMASA